MNIGIFTLMTGVYGRYLNDFISTISNFMPAHKNKQIVILSDGLEQFDNTFYKGHHITVENIIDYPYPMINLNKYQIIYEYAKKYGFDYIAYFDADTIFVKKTKEWWEQFESYILDNKIICPLHTHYNNEDYMNQYDNKINNIFGVNIDGTLYGWGDESVCNFDFINKHQTWVIASMFIMSIDTLKEVSEKIKTLAYKNNREFRRVLKFPEETLFNLMYYYDYLNEKSAKYMIRRYISTTLDINDDQFIIQKYDESKKFTKKYGNAKKTFCIYVEKELTNQQIYILDKIYANHIYDSIFYYVFNVENYELLLQKTMNIVLADSWCTFYKEWFDRKNAFYTTYFIEEFLPSYAKYHNNIIIIRNIFEGLLDIDFDSLCNDECLCFDSNVSFEESKMLKNVDWIYFTYDFIKDNYVNYG